MIQYQYLSPPLTHVLRKLRNVPGRATFILPVLGGYHDGFDEYWTIEAPGNTDEVGMCGRRAGLHVSFTTTFRS